MNLHRIFRQRKLSVVVCTFLLAVYGFLPKNAMGGGVSAVELSLDSIQLKGHFSLSLSVGLEALILLNMTPNAINLTGEEEWKPLLMTEEEAGFSLILNEIKDDTLLDANFDEIRVSAEDVVSLSYTGSSSIIGVFPGVLETDFLIEGKGGEVNLLSPYLILPSRLTLLPVSAPPSQVSTPDPLSFFILSVGGLALLSWSRHKRNNQKGLIL